MDHSRRVRAIYGHDYKRVYRASEADESPEKRCYPCRMPSDSYVFCLWAVTDAAHMHSFQSLLSFTLSLALLRRASSKAA